MQRQLFCNAINIQLNLETNMRILGISGSKRAPATSGTYQLVEHVLKATGLEYDLISLHDKRISGCTACLSCAKDNICVLNDDMRPIRELIESADAYVIGSPNYYSGINATTHAFLERLFQFRHRDGDSLWGKLAVAIGVGGVSGQLATDNIEKFMLYNLIETVAKVAGQGTASCFTCGYGEGCKVGIPCMMYGENSTITDDMIPSVMKQPDTLNSAREAGILLANRLKSNHNRNNVAEEMNLQLGRHFSESV